MPKQEIQISETQELDLTLSWDVGASSFTATSPDDIYVLEAGKASRTYAFTFNGLNRALGENITDREIMRVTAHLRRLADKGVLYVVTPYLAPSDDTLALMREYPLDDQHRPIELQRLHSHEI